MKCAEELLLGDRPVERIAEAVHGGAVGARAVAEAALAQIAAKDRLINAFTDVTRERALAEAEAVDAARAAGRDPGPLAGVPYAVKNLVDVEGLPTRAGSKINRDLPPAQGDGAVVAQLKQAGAVLLGALNMGEYAYDFTGENAHDGPSRNPRDPDRMSGGSSGGSGAAVAAGFVPLAVGSDTNGSIRVPSSLCGIFGLKPTFGRVSRAGSFPFVASLDHLGPLARSARDLALAYDALQGHDPADPVSVKRPAEPAAPELEKGADGLRIAVAADYFERGGAPEAHQAVETVAVSLQATRRVAIPEAQRARAAAYVITASEGGALHRLRLAARAADFDPATRDRFIAGALIPAAWYVQAQRFRRWYRARVLELFRDVDVLLAPATPVTAPKLGQVTMTLGGTELPVRANLGLFTQPISFIGLPVAVAPVQCPGGLPIGVQIIAAPWREGDTLRVAYELERRGIARAPAAL
jgi:aspartyl-tRNA(Asn)/glutamyl-tRNA(Gln) amidotransferase subunit A